MSVGRGTLNALCPSHSAGFAAVSTHGLAMWGGRLPAIVCGGHIAAVTSGASVKTKVNMITKRSRGIASK